MLLLHALFLCYPALALSSGTLSGTVCDSEGAAIGNAHIMVRPDMSGKKSQGVMSDIRLTVDKKGHFETRLSPGFYDLCVMADAFTPECQKVFLGSGSVIAQRFRLQISPVVVKQLGDKF
jgi:hypothetical protein